LAYTQRLQLGELLEAGHADFRDLLRRKPHRVEVADSFQAGEAGISDLRPG